VLSLILADLLGYTKHDIIHKTGIT